METGQHGQHGAPVVGLAVEEIKHRPEIVVTQHQPMVEKTVVQQI